MMTKKIDGTSDTVRKDGPACSQAQLCELPLLMCIFKFRFVLQNRSKRLSKLMQAMTLSSQTSMDPELWSRIAVEQTNPNWLSYNELHFCSASTGNEVAM